MELFHNAVAPNLFVPMRTSESLWDSSKTYTWMGQISWVKFCLRCFELCAQGLDQIRLRNGSLLLMEIHQKGEIQTSKAMFSGLPQLSYDK